MKKLTSIIITFVMTISILGVASITANATATINIGDYIQMGKYYDEPILWRCVDIDENGPLMLADRILTIKAFDTAGNHTYADGTLQPVDNNGWRRSWGSNLWETSNMRSWLNSTEISGNVTWLDGCPPTEANVWYGYNDYATEKGFLAEGNFTVSEQNAIKTVTQKSILNGIDVPKLKVGGTANHTYDSNISTVVQNYDTAYYHNVTDKIFLLDVKQLNKVYQNSTILGTNYYIGKPTQKAVDNSEYKDNRLSNGTNWNYWNRTPYTFEGWYTDSGLTATAVAGVIITANTTLYAKWSVTAVIYTVTYSTDGGSTVSDLTGVTALPSTLPTTTKAGYRNSSSS